MNYRWLKWTQLINTLLGILDAKLAYVRGNLGEAIFWVIFAAFFAGAAFYNFRKEWEQ